MRMSAVTDEIKTEVVGRDSISRILKTTFPNGSVMFSRLSECCGASAKGVEYGTHVACRRCYAELDPEFGMAWEDADDLRRWVDEAKEWDL
jgi:hypothetical protein